MLEGCGGYRQCVTFYEYPVRNILAGDIRTNDIEGEHEETEEEDEALVKPHTDGPSLAQDRPVSLGVLVLSLEHEFQKHRPLMRRTLA